MKSEAHCHTCKHCVSYAPLVEYMKRSFSVAYICSKIHAEVYKHQVELFKMVGCRSWEAA